ncbi:(2Fe-2S)-binding protein [Clostridium estertheticum]|nr:(2Fe-2S)-binding protein [Clostridium estertheticum]
MEQVSVCPVCKEHVQEVKDITVKHFVLNSLVSKVQEGNYGICLNEDCDVVYYDLEANVIFKKQDIKYPIWYKKDANPKYICYCNKVTEEQIINAVLNDGAKNIKDINKLTGAMKNGKCEINNPLGKCCSPFIKETVIKALQIKNYTKT